MRHVKTQSDDTRVVVGLDAPDDAAVYQVTDDVAIVQTVDFFTPIVDDPFAWGRIAAANSLSDIYAMGARPAFALNLIGWPRRLDFEILGRVLDGSSEACTEAGVSIIGGHSVDDPEPKYGLAVTGTIDPDRIVLKRGAMPGCDLVLTKPLGMGIIATGIKEDVTSAEAASRATEIMGRLNKNACDAMLEVGVAAATDVTGFGLLGHLLEMLGEDLSAELEFSSIPFVEEAVDLAAKDVIPGGSRRNREATERRVDLGALEMAQSWILFDAQTSGGLLMAVMPEKIESLLAALVDHGVTDARCIGRVVTGDGSVMVR